MLLFVFPACLSDGKKNAKGKKESSFLKLPRKTPSVVTAPVQTREVPLVITKTGTTQASDRFQAKAAANLKVQKILVEEGAKVQAGDALVKFDDQVVRLRVNKAQAEIKEAEAGLEYMNFLQQNKDKLVQDEKMSAAEADGLDERTALYQAVLDRAKAEIELYEGDDASEQINSPIAGIVTKKGTSDGSDVASEQVLLEVIRLDPIKFVCNVPVTAAASVEKGVDFSVRFKAFPGQDFTGQVASIGAESKSEADTVEVAVELPNPELQLKSDMRGEIVLRTRDTQKIITVPESALLRAEKNTSAFKLDGKHVKKVTIDPGDASEGRVAVEKGLAEGDLVVLNPDEDLKDGMEVEATTNAPETAP